MLAADFALLCPPYAWIPAFAGMTWGTKDSPLQRGLGMSWAHHDTPLRGDRGTVQRNAAGSLRVSLESPVILSPKNGGPRGLNTPTQEPQPVGLTL
jgi:hypothetical protein